MTETELIHIALEYLQKNTGITGRWEELNTNELAGKLDIIFDNQTINLNVEIKNDLRYHQLPAIFELASRYDNLMVVANKIYPKIKDELRKNKIAYLETNGNIWLQKNKILLWIETQKSMKEDKQKTNRAFTKTGLKVVLHFLLQEQDVNLTYRELAAVTDVGLGNINYIITGLKDLGFLIKVGNKQYKLINKKALLEKWIPAFAERLQPAIFMGTFRFLSDEDFLNWKSLNLQENKTWWGGEPAADLLTNHLRPATFTLYTTETRNDVIKNYRLLPDEKGIVKVYKKCWYTNNTNQITAPPLLVYADLLNTGDARCIQAAQKIYDEYLQDKF